MTAVVGVVCTDSVGECTVHVVDRRALFAEALAASLWRAGVPASAGDVEDCGPDVLVVLLDADREVADVADDVARVRRRAPGAQILLVGRDASTRRSLTRRVGADFFVSRSTTLTELRSYLRGGDSAAIRRAGHTSSGDATSTLTEREIEILRAMAGGGTTHAVAQTLGISPHTVRTHLQNIHVKLGVRTRLAAVTAARSAGLLRRIPLQAVRS